MLGTGQADALCAELACLACVVRSVGIGADLQTAIFVGPCHDSAELAGDGGIDGGDDAVVDLAGRAVERDEVALVEGLAGESELLVGLVHLNVAAAGNAALAHAAGNDCRVAGHAAANGQNALCGLHALDILGRGLKTDENDLFTALVPCLCFLSGEHCLAACRAGRCAQALAHRSCGLESGSVELGVQQSVEVSRIYHRNSFFFADHALVNEVACDLERRLRGALAVTGLKHVELAVFDGKLHVLHIAVVVFEGLADVLELSECFGELLRHLCDGHRGTDACDNILALCIGQELAHKLLLAGSGVAGERNAGAAVVAHVAEGHHLNVDGGAPAVGDVVIAAVNVCTGVVPAAENCLDSSHELLLRVGREVLADLFLVFRLELACKLLEVVRGQLNVLSYAASLFHFINKLLEVFFADLHDNVGVHLDEAAVAVPCPAGVVGLLGHDFNDLLVKTEVEDRVHHTGHGCACAGANGDEERIFKIAELLAGDAFHLHYILHDLGHDLVVDLLTVFIVLCAGLGGNGEALRYGQTDVSHFCQIRTLAAEKLAHFRVAFGEQVNILLAHWCNHPFYAYMH